MIESGYLVDTDVIINYLKGKKNSKEFFMKIIEGKAFGFFSVITEAELLSGARNAKEEANIYDLLDIMDAIELERRMAVTAGKLRRKYDAYGIGLPDALIAATTKEMDLIVATGNEKHFKVFDEIEKEYVKEDLSYAQ
ncbi:MAG: type II toxin-antitoxin system VapC family toxin [Candidatus Methanoperedens sp.]